MRAGKVRWMLLYTSICLFLEFMPMEKSNCIEVENYVLSSFNLKRDVLIDFYIPPDIQYQHVSLLLINDGQDLVTMNFSNILDELYISQQVKPLLCVGIHCGSDRRNEYATAGRLDYKGRGTKAAAYTKFIFEELLF